MNVFRYKPYYRYDSPSSANPLREELSPEDQERNINLFYEDVINTFEADDAAVSRDQQGIVTIETCLSKKQCDDQVAEILTSLDLYGHKL